MSDVFHRALKCRECGREYEIAPIFSCEFCFGPLEVAYDYDAIREATTRDTIAAGPSTLWRYANLLPCDPKYRVDLGDGYTPLIKADRLAKAIGLDTLWLKNDTVNPTWSFKDRVKRNFAAKPVATILLGTGSPHIEGICRMGVKRKFENRVNHTTF